ncbi:MAG TPA: L-2-hydroxyglutarate oxidase, partial [Mycobacterium sp.]|nr:L-2-hydroxyglutarate oxidase [Mycobacterium sp.]
MTDRVAVVGGGILGVAVAREILRRQPDTDVTLFEKEDRLASHQTGRNSGVVHAGLYYQPGSAKAVLCRRGVGLLEQFCEERGIRRIACGKVLVALDDVERARLDDIKQRAIANGVPGVRTIGPEELRELEPHVRGIAALHSPSTSIVDFAEITQALAADAVAAGAKILLGHEVIGLQATATEVVVSARTAGGTDQSVFDQVVACGGLQSDRLAELVGDGPDPVIMPFRGEYYALKPERRGLVNGLVYPVPDPRYPFLGVHVTPRVDGEVLIGPNAVLA